MGIGQILGEVEEVAVGVSIDEDAHRFSRMIVQYENRAIRSNPEGVGRDESCGDDDGLAEVQGVAVVVAILNAENESVRRIADEQGVVVGEGDSEK